MPTMKLRLCTSLNCLSVVASLALFFPGVAVAGTFSPPATLGALPNSSNVALGTPAAAIDGAGTAAVAFDQQTFPVSSQPNLMQVRTSPLGGAWSATTNLSFPGTLVDGALISVEGGEA